MKNKHLTAADRRAIEVLLNEEKYTQEEIALKVSISPSRLSRELSRCPRGAYDSARAQADYETQRLRSRPPKKFDTRTRQAHLTDKLQLGWSPEQISGRLKKNNGNWYVCPETIYQFLYSDPWARVEQLRPSQIWSEETQETRGEISP